MVSEEERSETSAEKPRSGARRVAVVVGSSVLIAGTIVALVQPTRVEPLRQSPVTSLDWWLYPVEQNAFQRLPVARGSLVAVYALRGTDDVWFAGEGGLIIHSTDGGRSWTSTNLSAVPQADTAMLGLPGRRSSAKKAMASAASHRDRFETPMIDVALHAPQQGARAPVQQSPVQQTPDPKSKATVIVPNVVGLRIEQAQAVLGRAGLRAFVPTVSGVQPAGVVLSQRPVAGSAAQIASTVELKWSPPAINPPPPETTSKRRDTTSSPSQSAPSTSSSSGPPPDSTKFFPTFDGLCFTSSGIGWAVGSRGAAFRSADRGATWTQISTGVTSDFESIACASSLGAVAIAPNRVVLLPRDGSTAELRSTHAVHGVAFSRADSALWSAIDPGSSAKPQTVVSRDTGRTWVVDQSAATWGAAIGFADDNHGFAIDSAGRLHATGDGGRTWSPELPCALGKARVQTIAASSSDAAMFVDEAQHMWTTRDGGRTCVESGTIVALNQLASASADIWYAADRSALRSRNGGRTWQSLVAETQFASVAFRDSLHGIAGIENGWVGLTSDAGRNWQVEHVDALTAPLKAFVWRTDEDVFAVSLNDRQDSVGHYSSSLWRSRDGGHSWSVRAPEDSILPVAFANPATGWSFAGKDSLYLTSDSAKTWTLAPKTGALALPDEDADGAAFLVDGGRIAQIWLSHGDTLRKWNGVREDTAFVGLIAASPLTPSFAYGLDTLGRLMQSATGGASWSPVPVRAPRKYPAPWYYAFAALTVASTLATSRRTKRAADVENSIADILVSDRPLRAGDPDILDFGKIAAGLSRFIRNTRTEPPLTIAITGPWGTGKSSLMQLLRRDLERRRFRTIWFNAWHHQREESLLASLLESIRLTSTPPVWTPKGLRFRSRLLAGRISRYAAAALAVLPVFALALGYILKDPTKRWHDLVAAVASIVGLFSASAAATANASGSSDLAQHKTVFAFIVSIVGTGLTYFKLFKAFGVKPETIAKSVAAGTSVRTIDAQPAFRYRFAQDFAEVTEALKPERLVIFVDDLDRCKPEQVLEILEAVNFLAESGDCVIVIGIDRERVTGCVAIGFKDVATVLAKTTMAAAKPDIAPAATKTDIEYQVEYARHYLEKLLNMEVPIPPATAEALGEVMTGTGPKPSTTEPRVEDSEVRGERRRRARRNVYAAAIVAIAAGMFATGWNGPQWLSRLAPEPATQPTVVQAGTPSSVPIGTASSSNTVEQPTPAARPASHDGAPIAFVVGSTPTTAWWMHILLAVAGLAVLVWLFTPREDNRVDDSPAFAAALKAWAPVLFEEHRTPRSAKKFLNKTRFLSMAQRAPVEQRAPVDVALTKLGSLPWLRRLFEMFDSRTQTTETLLAGSIPEVALVSLNVIRDRYPAWLKDPQFWRTDLRAYVRLRVSPVPEDLEKALDALEKSRSFDGGPLQTLKWWEKPWSQLEVWIRDDDEQ